MSLEFDFYHSETPFTELKFNKLQCWLKIRKTANVLITSGSDTVNFLEKNFGAVPVLTHQVSNLSCNQLIICYL